jgi:hypothetical protein
MKEYLIVNAIAIIVLVTVGPGSSLLDLQLVSATTNTTNADPSSNISTPTGFFDRTGQCLALEDADERNDCFEAIIEDKTAQN